MTTWQPGSEPLQRTSRDREDVGAVLAGWLADRLPPEGHPDVHLHQGSDANGMSAETWLLDVSWVEGGVRQEGEYVVRVEPHPQDLPVFPHYDLSAQAATMRAVAERTAVPVPTVRWADFSGQVLGTPFFVMDRLAGRVPPDVPPYTFGDNWLADAGPAERRRLVERTLWILAELHAVPAAARTLPFLVRTDAPTALAGQLLRVQEWYAFAAAGIGRSLLVERALRWLGDHLPATDEAVLCWGDSRIGNILYQGFEPAGVLDWEMAGLGPRELDLAWLCFCHRVFQHIASEFGLPGLPDLLREEEVWSAYQALTGHRPGDPTWYYVLHAVQWACVFLRTGARQVRFGEIPPPDAVENLFYHRGLLESLLHQAERGGR